MTKGMVLRMKRGKKNKWLTFSRKKQIIFSSYDAFHNHIIFTANFINVMTTTNISGEIDRFSIDFAQNPKQNGRNQPFFHRFRPKYSNRQDNKRSDLTATVCHDYQKSSPSTAFRSQGCLHKNHPKAVFAKNLRLFWRNPMFFMSFRQKSRTFLAKLSCFPSISPDVLKSAGE